MNKVVGLFTKVVFQRSHSEAAAQVQEWLDQHPMVEVAHLAASSAQYGHCITLVARESERTNRYRFDLVRVASPLDTHAFENSVQGPGTLQMIAQSANEYGHWTALLFSL